MKYNSESDIPFPSDSTEPLERIVYISLPEDAERNIDNLEIDSSIPLPVEPPPGTDSTQLTDLSWEMIVSAMLKICAYQPEHPHLEYFKGFIRTIQPDIVEKMTRMGIVKAQEHQFEIAEEVFRTLVNFAPEEENNFINLALVFEESAEYLNEQMETEQAEEHISAAHKAYTRGFCRHPRSEQLHYNAGNFFLRRNNLEKAREHFDAYLELDRQDSEKRQNIVSLLRELDTRSMDDTLFSEAYDYIKMGQEERGVEKIHDFLRKNPKVWNAWFLLGWGLRKMEKYEQARDAFSQCVELNDANPDAYNELAICNLELEEYKQAKANLEKALTIEPENTKVMSNLGILALKQGDFDLAGRFFRTVLELDPADPVASVYLDKINGES